LNACLKGTPTSCIATIPAFAAITDAKTKAECEKAGGVWMEETKKCGAKKPQ